jgi:hypothetical protein
MHNDKSESQGQAFQNRREAQRPEEGESSPECVIEALEQDIAARARKLRRLTALGLILVLLALALALALARFVLDSQVAMLLTGKLVVLVVFVVFVVFVFYHGSATDRLGNMRREFIRIAPFPPQLSDSLIAAHPQLSRADADLVLRVLRQFFESYRDAQDDSWLSRPYIAMPSKVVDTAWHEFILDTRAYARWCKAAFGHFLHHHPLPRRGDSWHWFRMRKHLKGLRCAWRGACREEGFDSTKVNQVPLLFKLDARFAIEDGFRYVHSYAANGEDGVFSLQDIKAPEVREKIGDCGGGS